jgi:hypothetical protein
MSMVGRSAKECVVGSFRIVRLASCYSFALSLREALTPSAIRPPSRKIPGMETSQRSHRAKCTAAGRALQMGSFSITRDRLRHVTAAAAFSPQDHPSVPLNAPGLSLYQPSCGNPIDWLRMILWKFFTCISPWGRIGLARFLVSTGDGGSGAALPSPKSSSSQPFGAVKISHDSIQKNTRCFRHGGGLRMRLLSAEC